MLLETVYHCSMPGWSSDLSTMVHEHLEKWLFRIPSGARERQGLHTEYYQSQKLRLYLAVCETKGKQFTAPKVIIENCLEWLNSSSAWSHRLTLLQLIVRNLDAVNQV